MSANNTLYPTGVAQSILLTDRFAQDPSGELYVFRSGHYQPGGEKHIKRRFKETNHVLGQAGGMEIQATYGDLRVDQGGRAGALGVPAR